MDHDHGAVARELHVELDEVRPHLERGGEGDQGVLRPVGRVAAVGDDERGHASTIARAGVTAKPGPAGEVLRWQEGVAWRARSSGTWTRRWTSWSPDGKLYVPDAVAITANLERLTRHARERGIPRVASVDDHTLEDSEISDTPDFRETFPPHCLHGTEGQKKIRRHRHDVPRGRAEPPGGPGRRARPRARPSRRDADREEPLRRVHEPQHRGGAGRAGPRDDRGLRRGAGRLRRPRHPRVPGAGRGVRGLRRGRRPAHRRRPGARAPRAVEAAGRAAWCGRRTCSRTDRTSARCFSLRSSSPCAPG